MRATPFASAGIIEREVSARDLFPVVVVSAVSTPGELGAARILQKPVDVKTLLRLVEEFCD